MDRCPRCLREISIEDGLDSWEYIEGLRYCIICCENWEKLEKDLLKAWKDEKLYSVSDDHLFFDSLIRYIPQNELKKIIKDKKQKYEYGIKNWKGLERKSLDYMKKEIEHLKEYIHDNTIQ